MLSFEIEWLQTVGVPSATQFCISRIFAKSDYCTQLALIVSMECECGIHGNISRQYEYHSHCNIYTIFRIKLSFESVMVLSQLHH